MNSHPPVPIEKPFSISHALVFGLGMGERF